MESYDVIANQPVVIDNVSSVFPISEETVLSSRRDRFRGFSLGRLLFVTGPACQAGSAAAAPVLSTSTVCTEGGQQHRVTENLRADKGKRCRLRRVLGPSAQGALTVLWDPSTRLLPGLPSLNWLLSPSILAYWSRLRALPD